MAGSPREPGDPPKDEDKDTEKRERLQDRPSDAEHRLPVFQADMTLGKGPDDFPISPQLPQRLRESGVAIAVQHSLKTLRHVPRPSRLAVGCAWDRQVR